MPRVLLSVLLLLGCGSKPAEPAVDAKPAAKPAKPAADQAPPLDRSNVPLQSTQDTVRGIPFTLDIPAGELKREARDEYVNWTFTDGNPFTNPSITVKPVRPPKDLDALEKTVTAGTDNPPLVVTARKQLEDGGMLVSAERSDGQYFVLHRIAGAGESTLRCSVMQRTGTGKPGEPAIPNLDTFRAWAEKLCTSLKPG